MKESNGMKRCPTCGETLPVSEFWKSYGTNDGYQVLCKTCQKAYQREYQARRRAANRLKNLGEKAGQ